MKSPLLAHNRPTAYALLQMHQRLTILLIDDNPDDLVLAEEAFKTHQDWTQLITHTNSSEAISSLQHQEHPVPDVIITDLDMPGLSGLDVLRIIKADPRLKLIPVVVLSNSGDLNDIQQAYSLHASAYLVKATDFQDFVKQMTALLTFWQKAKIVRI